MPGMGTTAGGAMRVRDVSRPTAADEAAAEALDAAVAEQQPSGRQPRQAAARARPSASTLSPRPRRSPAAPPSGLADNDSDVTAAPAAPGDDPSGSTDQDRRSSAASRRRRHRQRPGPA